MCSSSPPHDQVHSVLLIFAMEEVAYLQDRGQGVQYILHYKIEDEEWAITPLILFSLSWSMCYTPPHNVVCIVLLILVMEDAVYLKGRGRGGV